MNPKGTVQYLKPFRPGQSGNLGGKPTGTRNRLAAALLQALADDFEKHGKTAILSCRSEAPARYLQIVSSLLPKELAVEAGATLVAIVAGVPGPAW